MSAYPVLMHTAIDATDCRSLAELYRQFLGLRYRPGDEIPTDGSDDDSGWLVLVDPAGHRVFAFQQVPALARPTWPAHDVPKQMHHDFRVPSIEELQRQRQRAEDLGATLLYDRTATTANRCMCLLTPPGIRSAFSSVPGSEPGHPHLPIPSTHATALAHELAANAAASRPPRRSRSTDELT